MRFTCTVYRAVAPEETKSKGNMRKALKSAGGDILINRVDKQGWEALEGANSNNSQPSSAMPQDCGGKKKKDKEIMCYSTRPMETFEVLNDLVVDRGPSPYVSLLELFGESQALCSEMFAEIFESNLILTDLTSLQVTKTT